VVHPKGLALGLQSIGYFPFVQVFEYFPVDVRVFERHHGFAYVVHQGTQKDFVLRLEAEGLCYGVPSQGRDQCVLPDYHPEEGG